MRSKGLSEELERRWHRAIAVVGEGHSLNEGRAGSAATQVRLERILEAPRKSYRRLL